MSRTISGGGGLRNRLTVVDQELLVRATDAGSTSLIDGSTNFISSAFLAVGAGADADTLISVQSKPLIIVFSVAVTSDFDLFLFEDPTVSANGTPLVAFNRDRAQAISVDTLFFQAPTVTTTGTTLATVLLPIGTAGTTTTIATGLAWLFKPNSLYIVRGTNTAGAGQQLTVSINAQEAA